MGWKSNQGINKICYLALFFMLSVILLGFFSTCNAADEKRYMESVTIDGTSSAYIPECISYLQDDNKSLNLKKVIFLPADRFDQKETGKSEEPANSVRWYRIPYKNTSGQAIPLMIEIAKPHLDHILLAETDLNGNIIQEHTLGRAFPFKMRPIQHRNFLIRASLADNDSRILFIRLETSSSLLLPIRFWQESTFWENNSKVSGTLGVFYGVMLAMILYNTFLFLMLKNKVYLSYILYLLSFSVLQTVWDGYSYQYLWPNLPQVDIHANPVVLSILTCTSLVFITLFIKIKESSMRIYHALLSAAAVFLALAVFSSLSDPIVSMSILMPCFAVAILLVVFVLIYTWNRKREYYYFVIGSTFVLSSAVISLFAEWGIFTDTWFTINAPKLGISLEAIILSFGLVDTIQSIKREKEAEERQNLLLQRLQFTTHRITAIHEPLKLIREVSAGMNQLIGVNPKVTIIRQDSKYIYQKFFSNSCSEQANPHELSFEQLQGLPSLLQAQKTIEMIALDQNSADFFGVRFGDVHAISILQNGDNEGFLLVSGNKMIYQNTKDILTLFIEQIGIAIRNVRIMAKMNQMAMTDSLTGLLNRNVFFEAAEEELGAVLNGKLALGLLLIDVDHFKQINDNFGHDVGDSVILALTATLRKNTSEGQITGRFGGDEFMILTKGLPMEGVSALAEKLRSSFTTEAQQTVNSEFHPTLSIGAVVVQNEVITFNQLFKFADRLLYLAKNQGRNRVILVEGPQSMV